MKIRTTYEVVTPESAEDGDVADRGWIDEEGTEYDLDAACDLLAGCEPSCSPSWSPGTWYTDADGETDYSDGSETRQSYHLVNATEEEARAIYAHVTRRR